MKTLDSIFDSILNQTIFKNKHCLQLNYTPETILHREKEIETLALALAPSLRLERPSNIFIYGLTGTGKTLVVQHVKKALLDKAAKQKIPLTILYINCKLKKVADTEYRILAELINQLGEKVPPTGLPTDQLYQKFIQIIDRKKQLIIIILDEVDQAVKRLSDDFLYNLTRINQELSKAQISLVGISNDLKFLDEIDPRVRSSLSEEELVFPPYNALQLQDILRLRAKEAFKEDVLEEGVIEKCAALAAHEHGDARRALDLLRVAGEIAEREKKKKVTIEHLDKAQKTIEADKVLLTIQTQPKQFQVILLTIINLLQKNNPKTKLYTGDVYNHYQELCSKLKLECLTQRRLSDIIGELDMQGIINAKVISKGRYGRTREIRLDLPEELQKKIINLLLDSLNLK